jgi:hypothetical protein
MSSQSRLRRIEEGLGWRDQCLCGPRGAQGCRVWWPVDRLTGQAQERPSDVCDVCGGEMVIIKVVFEKPVLVNWYADEVA